jgi:hypothetical protein
MTKNKYILIFSTFLVLFGALRSSSLQAAPSNHYGAGVMLGSFTAISLHYNKDVHSYVAGVAWDLGDDRKIHLHIDKLYNKHNGLKISGQVLSWYYGLGARFRSFDSNRSDAEFRLGARTSAGVEYDFDNIPLMIFLEAAFVLDFVPGISSDLETNLGVRYYFD